MKELQSIWRIELLHPQLVHFTVALLMFGSFLLGIAFLFRKRNKRFLSDVGQLLIGAGTLFSWVAVYTGTLADSEVGRTLCDPTVLEEHEHRAFTLSYIFSGVSVLFLLNKLSPFFHKLGALLHIVLLAAILTGNGFLIYTAHLGGKVVYQQGGAVHHPSKDCSEFE